MPEPLEEIPESVQTVKVYLGNSPFPIATYTRDEWNREVAQVNPVRAVLHQEFLDAYGRLSEQGNH